MKCTIEKCFKQSKARGLCSSHYMRVKRYGDPFGGSRFNYGKGWIRPDGYLVINKNRVNRMVAEKMLGRKIGINEDVHHINENKLDNRPENLLVLTKSQHSIQFSGRRKHFICTINGCGSRHKSKGLCQKHYMQVRRHGKIN